MLQPMTKERALKMAIASTEMEGLVVTDEHKALLNKLINNKITYEEALKQIMSKYHKENG